MSDGRDPFREEWEAEIAGSRPPVRAASLATTAQAAVHAWREFSRRAVIAVAEARTRAVVTLANAERAVREVAPVVGRGILAVSQATAVTYAEHLNRQYRESNDLLRSRGWWALSSWPDPQLASYAQIAESGTSVALDRQLCDDYQADGGHRLLELVDTWWDVPAFRLRRPIILDAVADHRRGRYRVSVPTLLPSIEGVVADTFDLGHRVRATAGLEALTEVFDGLDAIVLDVAIGQLTYLYSRADFPATSPLSPRLNRHLILHGRTVRYGREANSLKVLLHLDELHTQLATKQRLEEGRTARLEERPIRMANDLVKLLGVPDEMIAAVRRLEPELEWPVRGTASRSGPPDAGRGPRLGRRL